MGDEIDSKQLEKCRGFLIYVSRTYRPFIPYLRGLHKTIDGWRGYQDFKGWKLTQSEIEAYINEHGVWDGPLEPGPSVKIKPRLKTDAAALKKFTNFLAPPKVMRQLRKATYICYGFGDSSGAGFGNCITIDGVNYSKFGTWLLEFEDNHSNFKELKNLVNAVSEASKAGLLEDTELFLFTDNMVAERAYYNGRSNRNKSLDKLVLKLWELQMHGKFVLYVFHVAGTRMIESGIYALSRGEFVGGVARGQSMLDFVPIHLLAIERSPKVLDWVKSWWPNEIGDLELMTPSDWFDKALIPGSYLWDVPPAASHVAVEQLCTLTHGLNNNFHIFIVPRLCTSLFRKRLGKCIDLLLTV